MNQEKIGKFIQNLRKEKKMTQQELADKLNVTDRAISHWENGRRLPDVSLFKPLCEIFNISVNELISGERIDKKTIMKKSEENIISTLNMNEKNQKKSKKIIGTLLIILIIIVISVVAYYRKLYPKFNIYAITISKSNVADSMKKYKVNDNTTIWYYELDELLLCDEARGQCYMSKDALNHNQTSIQKIIKFLNSQFELKNVKRLSLWDGGTKIYSNLMYSIIVCDTLDGNKDIYVGTSDMVGKLNNGYCGHVENTTKKFTRTYYIVSVTDNDDEDYINLLDKNNFNKVYMLLKNNNFYFIDDIILNYLELFEIEEKYVQLAITDIKSVLGDNFVEQIGKNMTLIDKIIELAISYSEA